MGAHPDRDGLPLVALEATAEAAGERMDVLAPERVLGRALGGARFTFR